MSRKLPKADALGYIGEGSVQQITLSIDRVVTGKGFESGQAPANRLLLSAGGDIAMVMLEEGPRQCRGADLWHDDGLEHGEPD